MISYQQFITESFVSSYEYKLPNNLEQEFYDFYSWTYLYQFLAYNRDSDEILDMEKIVTDALETVTNKNIETMQKALVIAITKYSSFVIHNMIEDKRRYNEAPKSEDTKVQEMKDKVFNFNKNVLATSPKELISFSKNHFLFRHMGIYDYPELKSQIEQKFKSLASYINAIHSFFKLIREDVWTNISEKTLQLFEVKNSLKDKMLFLDIVYHLEHNTGHIAEYVKDIKWMKVALNIKFQDEMEGFRRSSIPEYVYKYLLRKLEVH
jgi:hypothetical protein